MFYVNVSHVFLSPICEFNDPTRIARGEESKQRLRDTAPSKGRGGAQDIPPDIPGEEKWGTILSVVHRVFFSSKSIGPFGYKRYNRGEMVLNDAILIVLSVY